MTQTTYVAWTAEPSNTGIDLCILPADSTTCEGGAPIDLVDSEYTGDLIPTLGDLYVLPGGIVVVLGVAGNEGSVEWESPAGGGAFAAAGQGLQSGGLPISTIENYYQADDAVPLGSNDLGVLDGEHNMFADVPLAGGTSPTPVAADSQEDFSHAPLGTGDAPQIGAEATPGSPGEETVVTVGDNENPGDQTVPAGCGNVYATGYGVRVGKIAGTSHSAGTLNSESPASQLLACSADAPVVVSGGAAGIGVVEQEGSGIDGFGSDFQLDFRPLTLRPAEARWSRRRAVRCDHPSAGRHR